MKDLILFPFGGNARESIVTIQAINSKSPTWNIRGFVDDNESLWRKSCLGVPVLGGTIRISEFENAQVLAVPGNPETYLKRAEVISHINIPLSQYATIIDPSVHSASALQVKGYTSVEVPDS